MLDWRIGLFLSLPITEIDHLALKEQLDEIGLGNKFQDRGV